MTRALDIETPLGPQAFVLTGFSGTEHMSSLSEFRVQLKSKNPNIAGEAMLGQNVTLRLELAVNLHTVRYFNGYVTRWAGVTEILDSVDGAKQTKAYIYEATIHPWLWFLTRQTNSRIFQNRTLPEIIKDVFGGHGSLASFENKLTRAYPSRVYCCQYRETDFNFVSRLMEEAGICYYVTHVNGRHTVVLADSSAHHTPYPHYEQISFGQSDRADTEVMARGARNTASSPASTSSTTTTPKCRAHRCLARRRRNASIRTPSSRSTTTPPATPRSTMAGTSPARVWTSCRRNTRPSAAAATCAASSPAACSSCNVIQWRPTTPGT